MEYVRSAVRLTEGAHASARPVEPWAWPNSGQPSAGGAASGSVTTPVTTVGSPASVSDRYMIRCQVTPSGAFSSGWVRMRSP